MREGELSLVKKSDLRIKTNKYKEKNCNLIYEKKFKNNFDFLSFENIYVNST